MKRPENSQETSCKILLHGPAAPTPDSLPRVLIVDDSAADAAAATSVLRHCGYAPEWVRDGLDAIGAIRDGSYACILLDLRMSVFGGQELIDYLAIESPEVLTRVVVVSGYPRAAEGLRGRVSGIVTKPISREKLRIAVAACLTENAARSAPLLAASPATS